MTKTINLNHARKAKTKAVETSQATANAFEFGRGKLEKALAKARESKRVAVLDAHKRET